MTPSPLCTDRCLTASCTLTQRARAVVRGAVLNLKDRLKALGVPLVIRSEGTAGALAQLATSTGSDLVLTEASCEQRCAPTASPLT